MLKKLTPLLLVACMLAACNGDFDQRQDEATTKGAGSTSVGTLPNQGGPRYIRGVVSNAGAVSGAYVTLRRINNDASIDFTTNLGNGVTFSNGIYQIYLTDLSYRGPILVEVRGGHPDPLGGEGLADRPADSPCRPGDNGPLIRKAGKHRNTSD